MEQDRITKRIVRLFKMEALLLSRPGGWRAVEIGKHFKVNRRTIYRDIETLCEIGVPIWQNNGQFGITGKYTIPDYRAEQIATLAP